MGRKLMDECLKNSELIVCPFCKTEMQSIHQKNLHMKICKEKMKIPEEYHYVGCLKKRHKNAKELCKNNKYIIDGIGDFDKIKVSIEECLNCKHQTVITDGIEVHNWIPYWSCSYNCRHGRGIYNIGWEIAICNNGGETLLSYLDNIDKDITRFCRWEDHVESCFNYSSLMKKGGYPHV